jgi:hypothetical protein
MELLPPDLPDHYPTLDALFLAVNTFAGPQGYGVVKKRSKKNAQGVIRKAWLRCDKGRDGKSQGFGKRETSIRSTECPFELVVTLEEEGWKLKIRNGDHNHTPTSRGSHPVHRRLARTAAVKEQIAVQSRTETRPQQIMSHLRLNADENDPLIKSQDLYNERLRIRQDALETLTSTQALLQQLSNKKHWFVSYYPSFSNLERLFFARNTCQLMTEYLLVVSFFFVLT